MFVYLFVCLFIDLFFILIILGHPQKYTLKISWRSNLIWLRYSRSKTCLFVCLFLCLFVDLFIFYFNNLGTPTGMYPENFVKIRLDLTEIYRILKNVYLFVCLFVCLLTCLFFILIFLGHPREYTLKILLGSELIWQRYSGSKKCLFVCLFVRLFVDLFIFLF